MAAGVTACDPNAPADCTKDCIDMVYANANADTVTLVGKGGGVIPEVTLYGDAGRTQVAGYAQSWAVAGYPTMPITKNYQGLPVQNPAKVQLEAATTYWYKAKASGAAGKTYTELGSFKTKQRIVTFTIDEIWVYDDSDFTGAGELTFDARVNGGSSRRVIQDLNWSSEKTQEGIGFTAKVTGVMNKVTLQVRGSDDDCTLSTCTVPASRWDAVGSNGDTQWSTITADVTVPGENKDGTFSTSTKAGGVGDIGFWIWGRWTVRYEYA